VIQDRTSRTLIGSSEQRDGVYYYKDTRLRQANAVNTRCLWHRRLGHPSSEVLSCLPLSLGAVGRKEIRMTFVKFVVVQNKLEIHFLLAKIMQNKILN